MMRLQPPRGPLAAASSMLGRDRTRRVRQRVAFVPLSWRSHDEGDGRNAPWDSYGRQLYARLVAVGLVALGAEGASCCGTQGGRTRATDDRATERRDHYIRVGDCNGS